MGTTIELAISCTWFQKRLCWMMSSVLQQVNSPNIVFNIAYPTNNGNPTTESVCRFFKDNGLNVKETVYPDERSMQLRGIVRNRQLAESKADWILFSDSDMVYDPSFFSDLNEQLGRRSLRRETKCIVAGRISLAKDYSKNYFNKEDKRVYPCVVENVADFVSKWPIYCITRPTGAGYFQLANVESVRKNCDGLFVNPKRCMDIPECDSYHKTNSDRQFRVRLGGRRMIHTKPQYHLNHERDNEEGCKHLTIQR